MAKDLGSMRIYEIVKEDSVYEKALRERISRLEMYKSGFLAGNIKREVSKSISLTKECHQIATNLKSTYTRLVKSYPVGTDKALDQVIASQMKAARKSKDSKKLSPPQMIEYALANQKSEYEIAKQLILEVMNGKGYKNGTMLDVANDKYPEDGTFERISLRTTIGLLANSYLTYMSVVNISGEFVKFAEIFRGLFYMGIVDFQGSELDEKELHNDLFDFAKEAAGVFVPTVGNMLSLANLINKLTDIIMDLHNTEVPEIVKEAQKLEAFLIKYQVSLKAWKSGAKSLIEQLDNFGKVIKQHQVT